MRLERRNTLLGAVILGGFAPLAYLALEHGTLWLLAAAVWLFGVGSLQFVLLRCPHCRNMAIRTTNGLYVPWTGTNCRYCGVEY